MAGLQVWAKGYKADAGIHPGLNPEQHRGPGSICSLILLTAAAVLPGDRGGKSSPLSEICSPSHVREDNRKQIRYWM